MYLSFTYLSSPMFAAFMEMAITVAEFLTQQTANEIIIDVDFN